MNDREARLLPGVLALQLNYISKEQLVAALATWAEKPQRDLGDVLIEKRFITEVQREALAGLVSAHMARTTGRGLPAGYQPSANESMDTIVMPKAGGSNPHLSPEPLGPGERFQLGPEIGRGGIARVIEATDAEIGRTVALKLMLENAPGDALERFRWEARITGKLEHPNIVPVHEVGALPGSKEIYFCMKRIYGRDMHHVIRERAKDDEEGRATVGRWTLRRLVEAFRDVCRAVAFAHSKGVIHRDLKPANVMLGEFGEVLVCDWGLAKDRGERPGMGEERAGGSGGMGIGMGMGQKSAAKMTAADASRPVTETGEILGTPAYMSPEQARGDRESLDERSDVYSLGAILYEILVGRPPYEGKTAEEVVKKVVASPLMPPSARAHVPPELEAICLKAMARRQEDRFATAGELAADVESYLEGTKEKERREGLAAGQVGKARDAVARWRALTKEAADANAEVMRLHESIPEYEGPSGRKPLWDMEERARTLDRDSITAFTEADAALASALSNVPGHHEAREVKAEMYWERFLEAESAGDERDMQLNRQTAEQFNDGVLDARLRGDGALSIRTRVFPCRCLSHGRLVRSDELGVLGLHPWSGRSLDQPDGLGLRELEPHEAHHLRLHSASCKPAPLNGAQVWAFRYEELDRLLIPTTPHGGATQVPRAVLDALFGSSPFRPRGGGVYLGRTPIPRQPWPMGSWLLIVVAEGRAPQRVPIVVVRQHDIELDLTLWAPEEIPAGFLPVAAGEFKYSGDKVGLAPNPLEHLTLPDFLIARNPVTCREYADYLNDVRRTAPEEAARRVPRAADKSGFYWPLDAAKGYAVPTADWLKAAPEAVRAQVAKLTNTTIDWEEDWPVTGISWEDGVVYSKWSSLRAGRLFHLPTEKQWEKSVRGPDGRVYPWGSTWEATFASSQQSHRTGGRPYPVSTYPTDESPYGVRGLGGNSSDRCLNEPNDMLPGRRITRGGSWARSGMLARAMYRSGGVTREVNGAIGIRLSSAVAPTLSS
ncbi:MAG: bifunctional serine/threonine-protein kinase/formylglycine-generating enzyme family protein [Planctomycetota bacterium]